MAGSVVVWVADDPSETDGNPLQDGTLATNPGRGVLAMMAHAYGRDGTRRVVEVTVHLDPPSSQVASRFVGLAQALPVSDDPAVQRYGARLREILDHHALMMSASLELLAVAWRSERLEDEIDRIAGLGRPAMRKVPL